MKHFLLKHVEKTTHYLLSTSVIAFIGYLLLSSIIEVYGKYTLYTRKDLIILLVYIFTYIIFSFMFFFMSKHTAKNISDMIKEIINITIDPKSKIINRKNDTN